MKTYIIALLFSIIELCVSAQSVNIYVSTTGDDTNPGTIKRPLRSMDGARQMVRKVKQEAGLTNINVLFRQGNYSITQSVDFNEMDSGTDKLSITYCAYPKESVVFDGGVRLKEKLFTPVKNRDILDRVISNQAKSLLLEYDLSRLEIDLGAIPRRGYAIKSAAGPEAALYIDQKLMTLARYPNLTAFEQIKKSHGKSSFSVDDNRITLWPKAKDIHTNGTLGLAWEWSVNKITKIDPDTKQITLLYDELNKIQLKGRFYYENLLEEIDTPGEYYIDREAKKLYLYPTDRWSPDSHIVLSSFAQNVINIRSASHLTFENLIFRYIRAPHHIIDITNGKNITIANCELSCSSSGGIKAVGERIKISASYFYDLGKVGIHLNGGNPKTLQGSGNIIENCKFENISQWHKTYMPAVDLAGVGNVVRNCEFGRMPHMAINIKGNDHIVEYCELFNNPGEYSDMLAIYLNTGNAPEHRGTIIRRNYFHDSNNQWKQSCGVYLDNETMGVSVLENIFVRNGGDENGWSVNIHGGGDNVVSNNIFVNCRFPFRVSLRLNGYMKKEFKKQLLYWQSRWKGNVTSAHLTKYPALTHFFDDEGIPPKKGSEYSFDIKYGKDDNDVLNYWNLRTPSSNIFTNNLIYNTEQGYFRMPETTPNLKIQNRGYYVVAEFRELSDTTRADNLTHSGNWHASSDPGFVDIAKDNFNLRKDAAALKNIKGFKAIPFDKIGLKVHAGAIK